MVFVSSEVSIWCFKDTTLDFLKKEMEKGNYGELCSLLIQKA